MSISSARIVRGITMLCLLLLFGITAQAQEPAPRDTANFVLITGVNSSSSCSALNVDIVRERVENVIVVGTVIYQGQVVTDAAFIYGPASGATSFGLNYSNSRGKAPINLFPLTPGKKIKIFITVYTLDWQPLYEARAVLNSCTSLTLASSSHGPAYQLMKNHSFEQYGFDAGMVQNDFKALFWKGSPSVLNDARVCSPPRIRGGSSNYVGLCGFLFIADPGTSSKITQVYSGTIGKAGDIAYLLGFAQSFTGYTGGGSFTANLTFANGATHTMKVPFPTGLSLYGVSPAAFPYEAFYVIPAPIVSANIVIKQKNGTGNVAVDAVTLSVFTNTNTPLRALPLPAPAGARTDVPVGVSGEF